MQLTAEEMSLIANSYEEAKKQVMEKYAMTSIEVDVMLFLANNPQFDTAAEIVSIRKIAKSHVSLAVSRLEQRGFLARIRDEKDRKKYHLCIQESASEMVRDGQEFQKSFREKMLSGFTEEERRQMSTFVERIAENLRQKNSK